MKRLYLAFVLAVSLSACGGGGGGSSTPVISVPPTPRGVAAVLHVGLPGNRAQSTLRFAMDATPSPSPTPMLATLPSYSMGVVPDAYLGAPAPAWSAQYKGVIAYLTDSSGSPLSAANMPNPAPTVTWVESGSTALSATEVPLSSTPDASFQSALTPAWNTGSATAPGQTTFTATALGQTAASVYSVYSGMGMARQGDPVGNFPTCVSFTSGGESSPGGMCDLSNDGTNLIVPGGATTITAADAPMQFATISAGSISNPETSIPLSQVYGKIVVLWTNDHRLVKWYPDVLLGNTAIYGGYQVCSPTGVCNY